jgi:hypothetical protein
MKLLALFVLILQQLSLNYHHLDSTSNYYVVDGYQIRKCWIVPKRIHHHRGSSFLSFSSSSSRNFHQQRPQQEQQQQQQRKLVLSLQTQHHNTRNEIEVMPSATTTRSTSSRSTSRNSIIQRPMNAWWLQFETRSDRSSSTMVGLPMSLLLLMMILVHPIQPSYAGSLLEEYGNTDFKTIQSSSTSSRTSESTTTSTTTTTTTTEINPSLRGCKFLFFYTFSQLDVVVVFSCSWSFFYLSLPHFVFCSSFVFFFIVSSFFSILKLFSCCCCCCCCSY